MTKKGYKPEQIIGKLREAEVLLNQGATVSEASRKIGVTEQTYYRCDLPPKGIPLIELEIPAFWSLEQVAGNPGHYAAAPHCTPGAIFR